MSDFIKNGNGFVLVRPPVSDEIATTTDLVQLNSDIFAQGIEPFGGIQRSTKWFAGKNVTDVLKNLIQNTYPVAEYPSVTINVDSSHIQDFPSLIKIPLNLTYNNGRYQYGPSDTGVIFSHIQITRSLYLDDTLVKSNTVLLANICGTDYLDNITFEKLYSVSYFNRIKYSVVVLYEQGVDPINSLGVIESDKRIISDYCTAESEFIDISNKTIYITADTVTTEPDIETDIVGIYSHIFSKDISLDNTFMIVVPPTTRRISFVIPNDSGYVPTVMYNAYLSDTTSYSSDCNYTDMFTTKTINLHILNTIIPCTVYTYITEVPFETGGRFTVVMQPTDQG